MDHLRNAIVTHVENTANDDNAVRQLYLAKPFGRHEWIRPAIIRIISRTKPLNEEEIRVLDASTICSLISLREKYRWDAINRLYAIPASVLEGPYPFESSLISPEITSLEASMKL
jgi:hypothetical protein